jgi:hypothetical protein
MSLTADNWLLFLATARTRLLSMAALAAAARTGSPRKCSLQRELQLASELSRHAGENCLVASRLLSDSATG